MGLFFKNVFQGGCPLQKQQLSNFLFLVQVIVKTKNRNKNKNKHNKTNESTRKYLHFQNVLHMPLSKINEWLISSKFILSYETCNGRGRMIVTLLLKRPLMDNFISATFIQATQFYFRMAAVINLGSLKLVIYSYKTQQRLIPNIPDKWPCF